MGTWKRAVMGKDLMSMGIYYLLAPSSSCTIFVVTGETGIDAQGCRWEGALRPDLVQAPSKQSTHGLQVSNAVVSQRCAVVG